MPWDLSLEVLREILAHDFSGTGVSPTTITQRLNRPLPRPGMSRSHVVEELAFYLNAGLLQRQRDPRDARGALYSIPDVDLVDKAQLFIFEMERAMMGAMYPFEVPSAARDSASLQASFQARAIGDASGFARGADHVRRIKVRPEEARLVFEQAALARSRILSEWSMRRSREAVRLYRSPWRRNGAVGPTERSLGMHGYEVKPTRMARNNRATAVLSDPDAHGLDTFRVPFADLAHALSAGHSLGDYVITSFGPPWTFHLFVSHAARLSNTVEFLFGSECPISLAELDSPLKDLGYKVTTDTVGEVSEKRLFERMRQFVARNAAFVLDAHAATPAKRRVLGYRNVLTLVDDGVTLSIPHYLRPKTRHSAGRDLSALRSALAGIHNRDVISESLESTVARDLSEIVPSIRRVA